jgi:FHS family L-fucose permease-like MFS transporter
MGLIADHSSMATGFIIPVLCYVVIAIFAIWGVGKVEGKLDMSNPVH